MNPDSIDEMKHEETYTLKFNINTKYYIRVEAKAN